MGGSTSWVKCQPGTVCSAAQASFSQVMAHVCGAAGACGTGSVVRQGIQALQLGVGGVQLVFVENLHTGATQRSRRHAFAAHPRAAEAAVVVLAVATGRAAGLEHS